MIFLKKTEIFRKWLPNGLQMGEVILGDFTLPRLVAPLAPQSVFLLKKYHQSVPKVSPRCQSTSESDPKLVKVRSELVLKCKNVLPKVKRKVTPQVIPKTI